MYQVWKLYAGTSELVDQQRDPAVAQAHALEQSRISDAVFYVVREHFSDPLFFAYRGALHNALNVLRQLSVTVTPPVFPLVQTTTADIIEEEPPKPRRRRKGPEETKAKPAMPTDFKQFPASVVGIDEDQGIVESLVAVMGNIDDGDDIIYPGAFTKTLAENGQRVRVLDSHNNRSTLSVIGRPLEIREVGRDAIPADLLMAHPEIQAALYTKTQYLLNTPEGKGTFERIKAGAIDQYSIGFDIIVGKPERIPDPKTGKEKVIRALRELRLWEYSPVVFAMNPLTRTLAVKTANNDLDPQANADPDAQKEMSPQGPIMRLGDTLAGRLFDALDFTLNMWLIEGKLEATEHSQIKALCSRHISAMLAEMMPDMALRDMTPMMWFSGNGADETKVGRVLSERNFSKVKQASDLLNEVLTSAGLTEGDDDPAMMSGDKSRTTSTTDDAADGPPASTNAPTPENGAGPQDDETPATKRAELLKQLAERLANVEVISDDNETEGRAV